MALRYDEVADLIRIIDASACEELILETSELKLVVRRHGAGPAQASVPSASPAVAAAPATTRPAGEPPAPVATRAPAWPAATAAAAAAGSVVTAPMVGTFYAAPSPDAPPFVEIGAVVEAGQPLCLIEVMKLFTTIYSERAGRVAEIGAENGQLVEFGQMLFVIE